MLTKSQIRYLKAAAHKLNPVVMIGNNGISEAIIKETERALTAHELIKIKLGNLPDEDQAEIISEITAKTASEFVAKIGHIGIFYRENPEKRGYKLPKD
ncbi:MAG: ribosome assembly RNA-binding protein YhbY [Cardiobacteriaceae bacterium]|nr:ribosome assembly RNA-binding protein YhbY [Cardiobacteriaceae bacterium]